jgi:hypothetical protein
MRLALELMATLPGVPFYAALGFDRVEDATDVLPDGTPIRFVRMRRPLRRGVTRDDASRSGGGPRRPRAESCMFST